MQTSWCQDPAIRWRVVNEWRSEKRADAQSDVRGRNSRRGDARMDGTKPCATAIGGTGNRSQRSEVPDGADTQDGRADARRTDGADFRPPRSVVEGVSGREAHRRRNHAEAQDQGGDPDTHPGPLPEVHDRRDHHRRPDDRAVGVLESRRTAPHRAREAVRGRCRRSRRGLSTPGHRRSPSVRRGKAARRG